ncbi:MAG TPA: AarF/UbiB family protein [Rubrobacteraceae bacterium]|nr:AarF/UbiB family protein [Rubrobacteraceae bacterium]
MEKVNQGPESPARRVAGIARVGARYGFGFVFGSRLIPHRRRAEPGRVGTRLRRSFEELGPTFVELGRYLASRRDLLPPDVAAELGRPAGAIRPVTFAEVRTLLERELGNTMERLFLSFEEGPARVGVFTQSHRAVLPGERPALVVVNRPGIRRDLLAMRPVADLTRRRLGDRLPLDPSVSVAEFVALAGHRRDMYFAAQTARRLRGLDGFGLRVPEVYRGYSSAKCVTLEAPAKSAVPDTSGYGAVSAALVRLAFEEGIFLADLAPERFVVGDGEVWLADPTETVALDLERLRGVAETLAAVRRGDVDGVTRVLPLAGTFVPRDTTELRRELRETLGALGGPLWREHSLSEARDRGLEALRKGKTKLNAELAQMLESMVAAERLGGERRTSIVEAAEAAEVVVARYRDPRYVAARTARKLAQPDAYADYPRQIHSFLEELKDGEVEVRFQHGGLDDLISKVDILANRLVFAVLIAALIIGSSMIGIFSEAGARLLGVSVFGLIGFVFAAILGLLLLIGIIRSGRL